MSTVQWFEFEGDSIRMEQIDGEPWFIASDVAKILGYRDAANMTRRLDAEDLRTRSVSTKVGLREMTAISEAGLFTAMLASQVEGARRFKRWVTHEVLPQIRQTGSYSRTDNPSASTPAPANVLASSEEIVALATHVLEQSVQLAVAAPKVEAFDELMDATGLFTMEQVAKSLGYGRNVLFRELRKLGILQGNNLPYQSHMRHFDIKVGVRQSHDGLMIPTSTTLVRPSGVEYLRKRFARAQADVAAGLPSLPGTQTSLSP